MTMLRVLPNRYIALLLTPREASMLEGQILEPGDYPWQDTEAQAVSLGVKSMLQSAVAEMTARELDASIDAIHRIEEMRREALGEREDTPTLHVEEQGSDPQTQEEPKNGGTESEGSPDPA